MNKGKNKKRISKAEWKRRWYQKEWYSLRALLGCNWARFYVLIGPRECGKSYSIMYYLVWCWKKKGIPFNWIRLSQESLDLMLANNGENFIDAPIRRKFNLDLKRKGNNLYDGDKLMCRGFALSTMAKQKGVALFDHEFLDDPNMWYHIGIDEFNKEKSEKHMVGGAGSIAYNLKNTLETLVRSTEERIRIFFAANQLEESSEVLSVCFNFTPLAYGRYKLKKKQAIIDFIEPNAAYLERRKQATANLLGGENDSTFTNEVKHDFSLVYKKRVLSPSYGIAFGENKNDKYVVWDNNIILPYKNENVSWVAMKAYKGFVFNKKQRDMVVDLFHRRNYRFDCLSTQIRFKSALEEVKPKG